MQTIGKENMDIRRDLICDRVIRKTTPDILFTKDARFVYHQSCDTYVRHLPESGILQFV